jgi:hypothetical protein
MFNVNFRLLKLYIYIYIYMHVLVCVSLNKLQNARCKDKNKITHSIFKKVSHNLRATCLTHLTLYQTESTTTFFIQ